MSNNDIYNDMIQPRGRPYRSDQIAAQSHYREPIDQSPGRLAGNSRVWGDATPEVQSRVIDALIASSRERGLTPRETAHVLAIARIESGFNPDAAAGTTSASGLGQFIDKTGRSYQLNNANRFDLNAQSDALVAHFIDNRDLARRRGQGEEYIYKYHHDGPTRDYGGLGLSRREVMPYVERYEQFVRQQLGQEQTTPRQQPGSQPRPEPQQPQTAHTEGVWPAPGNRQLNRADRPLEGHGEFGTSRGNGSRRHGGVDIQGDVGDSIVAYAAGTVRVQRNNGAAGNTVTIDHGGGVVTRYMHLQDINVRDGQRVDAGQQIATMGRTGNTPRQGDTHLHFEMLRDGRKVDPMPYLRGLAVEQSAPRQSSPANVLADGVLRQNERGADVQGLQASLNRLQMTDATGQSLREDGNFGQRTREAVERFQRENGLKVDGIAGPRTLEAIGQRLPPRTVTVERAEVTGLAGGRNSQTQTPQPQAQTPLITDAAHPNNALYAAIARQLPPGTRPEAIANVTLQAMENGMTDPSKLGRVGVNNNDAFVMPAGSFGGNWVKVDLSAPTASLKAMSDHMAGETRDAQQQQQQRQNTQIIQNPEPNRPGPVMV